MRFRTGKYAGMTLDHVRAIAPWYIQWVRENRPEMLKERTPSKPKIKSKPKNEFAAEKPAPYLASLEEAFGVNIPIND